jgi:hypothetical protein
VIAAPAKTKRRMPVFRSRLIWINAEPRDFLRE